MAKDDYFVIVYKLLAYLYVQLKRGEPIEPEMIRHDGALLQVNERYWAYIMRNLVESGFVGGITVRKPWGRDDLVEGLEDAEITPAGIAYLCENSLLERAKQFLKDIKDITPFI